MLRAIVGRLSLAMAGVASYFALAASFRVNSPATFCLLGGLVVFAFGAFVLLRSPRGQVNRAFFYLSLCFTAFLVLVYLLHIATSVGLGRVGTAVWILRNGLLLAPPAMIYFTYRFVGGRGRFLRLAAWAALASMAPFVAANVAGAYVTEYQVMGWTYMPAGDLRLYRLASLLTVFWAVFSAAVVVAQLYVPAQRPRRAQFTLFLVGWGLAIGHAFLGYLPAFNGHWYPWYTGVTWMIFPAVLSIAVVRPSGSDGWSCSPWWAWASSPPSKCSSMDWTGSSSGPRRSSTASWPRPGRATWRPARRRPSPGWRPATRARSSSWRGRPSSSGGARSPW
jgi:hypothetical protein